MAYLIATRQKVHEVTWCSSSPVPVMCIVAFLQPVQVLVPHVATGLLLFTLMSHLPADQYLCNPYLLTGHGRCFPEPRGPKAFRGAGAGAHVHPGKEGVLEASLSSFVSPWGRVDCLPAPMIRRNVKAMQCCSGAGFEAHVHLGEEGMLPCCDALAVMPYRGPCHAAAARLLKCTCRDASQVRYSGASLAAGAARAQGVR